MLAPVQTILTAIQASLLLIVPVVVGIALCVYGLIMATGDHSNGRRGMIFAFIGGAVALGSTTMAAAIHP